MALSEPTHGAQPKRSKPWEEQISPVLPEGQHACGRRQTYDSNQRVVRQPPHSPSKTPCDRWMCWPALSLDLHFLTHLVEQLLSIYVAAVLAWSFS